ncbi:hypothetical protein MTR_3g102480 [Medicago truncatula]|uniref:Uncharacterized protein n=1 Tax=Medicago truncatula TaxID=3880 RepID=A0A072V247_MEDTR|nr:hypothetical protein MTR_3g102480 [Medicago truncatula]
MRILRWMSGKTRHDKIRNDTIRERMEVAPIVEKLVENRLRWFGHVERRPVDAVVRRVDQMEESQPTPVSGIRLGCCCIEHNLMVEIQLQSLFDCKESISLVIGYGWEISESS